MRQTVSKDIYAYWNNLRGERSAPDRCEIDPAAIRHLLADSFLIEVDRDCFFPIRLCGTRLNALWREEQKGKSFLDLWRPEDRRNVAAALLTVIDGVTPIVGGASAQKRGKRQGEDRDMDLELLLLPLRNFGKTHSRVLGALSTTSPANWFGRAEAAPLQLKSLRVIYAADNQNESPVVGARLKTPPGRPQLIVYNGGRVD